MAQQEEEPEDQEGRCRPRHRRQGQGRRGQGHRGLSEQDRVIVEGVNRVKRHTKVVNQGGRAGTTGGIITQEAAIHVSNVMLLVDAPRASEQGQGHHARRLPPRRGHQAPPDGSTYTAQRSVRVARKSGEEI